MTLAAGSHTGESIAFWILAPIATLSALAMVIARNAVHCALYLAGVMLSLAGLYAIQDAPFLAAVQVIVYTGAILMLFLFVIMLVGVDSSDSLVETLRGQRVAALLVGLGFAGLLGSTIVGAVGDGNVGLDDVNKEGNVVGIARLLFTDYVFAFEVTSALLITAALGAMVLAHKERLVPKLTQKQLSRQRFSSHHPFPLPGPGVFAEGDSIARGALLPDGSIAPDSLAPTLQELPATSTDQNEGSRRHEP
ncbi:MAG: NADH-ubiquinone/plastoquinone oxidoreductase chain 6 [Frankiales bacterium]|nr:NADH-ubiquinone/plastoquinone oxidoreductase chain 6 [Frankiales bacterium]